jgi:hypothetical protein
MATRAHSTIAPVPRRRRPTFAHAMAAAAGMRHEFEPLALAPGRLTIEQQRTALAPAHDALATYDAAWRFTLPELLEAGAIAACLALPAALYLWGVA